MVVGGGKEGRQTVSELEGCEVEEVGGAGGGGGVLSYSPLSQRSAVFQMSLFYEAPQHSLHIKPNGEPWPQLPPRQTHLATSLQVKHTPHAELPNPGLRHSPLVLAPNHLIRREKNALGMWTVGIEQEVGKEGEFSDSLIDWNCR